ncbi:hypothetical protein CC78DRAFT_528425 [Lojkania enalia]|uniref:TAP-C domain-containing protein n=1 Tax=Lojkania enalia TaxID=147567 RepID=A0A9P4TRQ8_9PLEO|nr:hypothetical protein CC78DRAFT_528425 [Didymosphaeria enalia]
MPVASTTSRRPRGIQKRRLDRDGDAIMGAAPQVKSARPPVSKSSTTLTDVKVTGWTDATEITRLTQFLERHASRRRPNATKSGPPASHIIKKSRVEGNVLTLRVLPDDVVAFSKINGFTFNSHHGSQKLSITGPGVRRRSHSPPTSTSTEKTPSEDKERTERANYLTKLLETFLERRYSPSEKLLNLSAMVADEELSKLGMFNSTSSQAKLFPVLTTIIENKLPTSEQKQEAIHSVSLNNNNLPDLQMVKSLAYTLPQIKNLDLSSNKFSSTKDLAAWKHKFRGLEHLILSDNPLVTSQAGWESEIIGWFPKLRFLNGIEVRTEAQLAPKTTPLPTTKSVSQETDGITNQYGLNPEQMAMVETVYQSTGMTVEYCIECLKAGGWNLDTAATVFNEQRDTLPPEAWINGQKPDM